MVDPVLDSPSGQAVLGLETSMPLGKPALRTSSSESRGEHHLLLESFSWPCSSAHRTTAG